MTLVGVLLGQYAIYRREERKAEKERESLRNALAVELRVSDDFLERLLYITYDTERFKEKFFRVTPKLFDEAFNSDLHAQLSNYRFTADQQPFSTSVYESNAGELGELDDKTARYVIEAYNQLGDLYTSLNHLSEVIGHDDLFLADDVDWSSGAGLSPEVLLHKTQIERNVRWAVIWQKFALSHLGDELSEDDRLAAVVAYSAGDPQSEDHRQLKQFIEKYRETHNLSLEDLVSGDHPKASEDTFAE